ncbi:MAG: tetratricopeptide repeat protein [Treponema sp.]|nr:tetratricopeptide repeat protein [Treponema sp.]
MSNRRFRSAYGMYLHRKQTVYTVFGVVFVIIIIGLLLVFLIPWKDKVGNEKNELVQLWEAGSYDEAFRVSGEMLQEKPLDYFLLTLHGFSSYQLAIAQINNFDTLTYIDTCIWSLRKALLSKEGAVDGRVQYVLGKAYYYKGFGFADLAVKFLEEARRASYTAQDISEYLGLSYAALQDYRNSVASFTLALDPGDEVEPGEGESGVTRHIPYPSDLLLLSIARSYLALEDVDTAHAYLQRCVDISKDSRTMVVARLLLGSILGTNGDVKGAEAQYMAILAEGGENADAHYQLGELYAGGGDPIRARAEWRKAYSIDPSHKPTRVRLNM